MAIFNNHRPLVARIDGNRSDLSVRRYCGPFPLGGCSPCAVSPPRSLLSFARVQPRSACKFSRRADAEMRPRATPSRAYFASHSIKRRDSVIECRRLIVPAPAARKSPLLAAIFPNYPSSLLLCSLHNRFLSWNGRWRSFREFSPSRALITANNRESDSCAESRFQAIHGRSRSTIKR